MSLLTDLVRYYKLDGNSTASIGPNAIEANMVYGAGKINQGAVFNGSTSRFNVGKPLLASAGSIALWVNPSNVLLSRRYISDAAGFIYFETDGSIFRFDIASGGIRRTSTAIPTSAWSHLVGTWNGVTMVLYLNGILIGSNACGNIANVTNDVYIGSANSTGTTMTGTIDEVGIWSRAITQTEVTQLYNSGNGLSYPFSSGNANFFSFM